MSPTLEHRGRSAEREFRLLAESIPQLVWTTGADGDCDYVNRRWCEYTGRPAAESQGLGWLESLHPEDRGRCRERWASATRAAEKFELKYRLRRADGVYRWFLARAEPLCDDGGRPVRWFGTATDIDDQKRPRPGDRRQKEVHYRRIVEAAQDGIWEADAEGTTVYVNGRMAAMLGYAPEEMIGRPLFDFVAAPDLAAARARFQSHLSGVRETFVWRWPRRDGSDVWTLASCSPITDAAGRFLGAVGIFADQTDRHKAEELLRSSEERFRASVETLLDCLGTFTAARDAAGRIVDFRVEYLNPAARAYTRRPMEEQLGRGLFELFPGLRAAGPFDACRRVVESGEPFGGEMFLDVECAGERGGRWFDLRVTRLGDGFVAAWRDVTGSKRAEQSLRESERRLSLALQASRDALWDWDLRAERVFLCDRWKEMRGYQPQEVGDDPAVWSDGIHPEDVGRVLGAVREHLDGRTPAFREEYRVRCKDGSYKWILDRGEAVRDDAGRPVRMTGFETDITDRMRMEEALREADRRKDEFLAMLAHELRNPLAPIRNAVHLLRLVESKEPAVALARDTIDRQVRHLVRLVDDLLDVSRVRRGKVQFRKERCDLARIVRQTAEDYRGTLEADGLRLDLRLPPSPVWVDGDPTRLAQVLTNTLQNAAKFTDRGGLVTVALEAGPSAGAATLRVRDTGIGMDPDLLRQVFEPFCQVEGSRDRSRGGLGLGLALVKGLTEAHGGTVSALSEGPGRGTEVVIRLPLGSGAAPVP